MAEVVGSGLFNAFAFAGASFLMSKLNSNGYTKEMHRHNIAMEKYTQQQNLWNQQRLQEIDRVSKLHYDQKTAEEDRRETNNDFDIYAEKLEEQEKRNKKVEEVSHYFQKTKPKLQYKPSPELQGYITDVKYIMAGLISTGIVLLV